MRTLISLFALSTLATGCFELGDIKVGGDTASADDTAAGEDTATDSDTATGEDTATDSDTAGEDTSGGEDTSVEDGTAELRFVSLTASVTLHADTLGGAVTVEQALTPFSGTAFQEVSAGTYDLYATNSDGELVRTEGVHLADGGHYSVAYTPAGALVVTETDEDGLASTDTRITYINLQEGSNATGYLTYYNSSTEMWEGPGRIFSLATDEAFTDDFAYITTAARLEVKFDGLDNLVVDWNTAAYMQLAPGTSINVYFWTEGDCSLDSTTCSPQILGQLADGSTASVAFISDDGVAWAG